MSLDYATLDLLRQSHPAWRLLRSDHAPLIASFFQRVFITPNVHLMAQADLAEALEDELFGLRARDAPDAFPKSALDYLNDWAANDKGWLRRCNARKRCAVRSEPRKTRLDAALPTTGAIGWSNWARRLPANSKTSSAGA